MTDTPPAYTEILSRVRRLAAHIDGQLSLIDDALEAMPAEEAMRQAETDANHLREKVSLLTLQHKSQQAQIKWLEEKIESQAATITRVQHSENAWITRIEELDAHNKRLVDELQDAKDMARNDAQRMENDFGIS